LLRNGPLSMTADCTDTFSPSGTTATVHANSTEANWLSSGVAQNSFSIVLGTDTANSLDQSGTTKTFDLEAPSGAVLRGQLTIAENWPPNPALPFQPRCAFNAYSMS
jgi:hypothetical protein